jgi:hypothetical protein
MRRFFAFVVMLAAGLLIPPPAASQTLSLGRPGLAFSALVGGPNPVPQSVSIGNAGAGALTWRITSTQPGWLQVGPASGAAPASVTATVNVAGLPAGVYRAGVAIASNDKVTPTAVLQVTLTVVQPEPGQAAYAVELEFIGYTGLVGGPDCKVNPNGYDTLTGIVVGRENVSEDEHVLYQGTLARVTAVDFCADRGRRGPNDDERVMCAATLVGTATMKVDLTVYNEEDRGGNLEASHDGGPFTSTVTGSCEAWEQAQWRADYPGSNEGGGGSPNGQPIDEARSGSVRLFANGRARLVVGTFPPADPQVGGWTLRVIEKLR